MTSEHWQGWKPPEPDPRPNQYPGHCRKCGHKIPAKAGQVRLVGGVWVLTPLPGTCTELAGLADA